MLTVLSGLIGFGTSLLPNLLDMGQDILDKRHEKSMIAAQTEAQLRLGAQKLEAQRLNIQVQRDITEITQQGRAYRARIQDQITAVSRASKFIAGLSASVRPVVTYLFVIEYLLITWSLAWLTIAQDGVTPDALDQILEDEFLALLTMMVTFWFGNRTFGKKKT